MEPMLPVLPDLGDVAVHPHWIWRAAALPESGTAMMSPVK
jgi:hypothetical protein